MARSSSMTRIFRPVPLSLLPGIVVSSTYCMRYTELVFGPKLHITLFFGGYQ